MKPCEVFKVKSSFLMSMRTSRSKPFEVLLNTGPGCVSCLHILSIATVRLFTLKIINNSHVPAIPIKKSLLIFSLIHYYTSTVPGY